MLRQLFLISCQRVLIPLEMCLEFDSGLQVEDAYIARNTTGDKLQFCMREFGMIFLLKVMIQTHLTMPRRSLVILI